MNHPWARTRPAPVLKMPDVRQGATNCAACGGALVERFPKRGHIVAACSQCGTGRTLVGPDFDPSAIYEAGYFEGGQHDGYASYAASETVLRREFRRTAASLARLSPHHGALLEVGCAYGFFMLEARRWFDVLGIEVSEEAVLEARRRGLTVLREQADGGTLAGMVPAHEGTFSAAVLLDVIEHLEEPGRTLGHISRLLSPGGVLLLTTGDFSSRIARFLGKRWRLMTPPQHLHFFTRAGICRLLESAGLCPIRIQHPWKTVPIGLALFQLLRGMPGCGRVPAALNGLGLSVNLWDAMQVVARKPPG